MATDSIGTRIKRRRQVLGMTQQDLAARLNVSKSTVANWESGKHFPLRYAGAVEEVLGIELAREPGDDRPEYDDPALQHIWETPGLSEEMRRGLIAAAVAIREQQRRRALRGLAVIDDAQDRAGRGFGGYRGGKRFAGRLEHAGDPFA